MAKTKSNTKITATLTEVAKLYHNEGLSHQQIAEKLSVSRSLITQYLIKAKEQGIVSIEVIEPESQQQELLEQFKAKTKLRHLKIIAQAHRSEELTRKALAASALELLQELAKDNMVLGLGWGRNVTAMVNVVSDLAPRAMQIVPLFGESSLHNDYTQMNHAVMTLSRAFDCRAGYLYAPMRVSSKEHKDILLQEASIKQISKLWSKLDISIMGIGALPPTPGMISFVGEKEIDELLDLCAVGDLCGYHFDQNGKFLAEDQFDIGCHPA